MIYEDILTLIGNTPLFHLNQIKKVHQLPFEVYAKLEKYNPAGSMKDRAAYFMIKGALERKKIHAQATIIEPTSGNTGIALACLANYYHLNCIIVMPKSVSLERRKLIQDYHAQLCLVDGGMKECVQMAQKIKDEIPNSCILSQFDNEDNIDAHYKTTGPEILKDLPDVDVVIDGIGTGGSISGIGKLMKEQKRKVLIIGVEPASSPLISKNEAHPHKIQGIGANFIPHNFKREYVDEIMVVTDEDAIATSQEMVKEEGIFVGISSGAALHAALQLKKKKEFINKKIVVIMPDGGERYTWN